MSEPRKQDDENPIESSSSHYISQSPSILRHATLARPVLSSTPSVVIALPDDEGINPLEETPEQRHRRRIRFLELRREHYSQMHHSTEQCTMSDVDEQSLQGEEDNNKPK